MNKIEQMHLDAIQLEQSSDITQHGSIIEFVSSDNYYDLAVKSAEITEQIACEFCAYCFENQEKLQHLDSYEKRFQEFLKTKQ